jgi:pectate lyase
MSVTPKTENGWGSVYNGGITGGAGGLEIEFTDFVDMWIWMKNNLTTSAIVTYTGPDFDRTGFPATFPNSTFSNTSRFEVQGLKNKTIRASQGQKLTFCMIRFRESSENIIWENWHQQDSLDDLIDIINDSVNIWIRHCRLNMNVFNQSPAPNVDGSIDIGIRANYIAITDCLIENGDKTNLISFSDNEPNDIGKMKVTIRRCKYLNCVQRKPRARYGQIGVEYSVIDDRGLTIFSKCIGVGKLARFFIYRCTFPGGSSAIFEDMQGNLAPEDFGALRSVENVIAPGQANTSEIRPELVTWDPRTEPNYTLEDWTAAEAEEWVNTWAGATMHLMSEPTIPSWSLTIASNNSDFGTVATVAVNPIEQGASVTVTATPLSGYKFDLWQDTSDGSTLSQSSTYTFNMPSNNLSLIGLFSSIVPPPPQPRKKIRMLKRLIILLISIIL